MKTLIIAIALMIVTSTSTNAQDRANVEFQNGYYAYYSNNSSCYILCNPAGSQIINSKSTIRVWNRNKTNIFTIQLTNNNCLKYFNAISTGLEFQRVRTSY